ncbi:hypothetical protein [Longimicrobium sp.]|uniref:hypothetical protein n=1 Tax=Longimicrobium sp. TaxID=2029185 RepID=UPI002BC79BDE|nr:hypothetical protein [Longimicrobium sp.]HSU14152.1 hypothetical protein [Longimicrobium sp.]
MKKLRLSIDELNVESFLTAGKAGDTGTVEGFDSTTGGQRLCGCTDNGDPCDTDGCGTYACSGGCTVGCPDTNYVTCATGSQRLCEC